MRPDFLITPYAVKACPDLRPSDGDVYAIVYWLEHLKDGKCTAGNPFIAEVLGIQERTVRAALDRLERYGFIQRFFEDTERKIRLEIRTLIRYAKVEPEKTAKPGKELAVKKETPGDFAKRFFSGDPEAVEEALQGFPRGQALDKELQKFVLYWTEPNRSGTKQLWQMKPTFDVRRRLFTWLNRAGTITGGARAGSSVTV